MGLLLRRFRRSFGWFGGLGLAFAILILVLLAGGGLVWDSRTINVLRPVLLLVVGLGVVAWTWGHYQKSVETTPYRQVLGPLLASQQEFCLLLRPFGSDGEVIVPFLPGGKSRFQVVPIGTVTATLTLEQVVARAARHRLKLPAYAVVDQKRTLAPPGPIYLRCANSEWQQAVTALLRRAHTIVILLPPGQDLRRAVEWEVSEILRLGRQSRVLIVLPPSDRQEYQHATLRRQAAVLLAAMSTRTSSFKTVPSAEINHYLNELPKDVLAIKVGRNDAAQYWYAEPRRWRRVASNTYASALEDALDANEKEFDGRDFSARYGRTGPTGIR
jgi:hypothetical protein